jgi:hypothetical protein
MIHLVMVCLSVPTSAALEPFLSVEFIPDSPITNWTHLAEITFYTSGSDGNCLPNAIITTEAATAISGM